MTKEDKKEAILHVYQAETALKQLREAIVSGDEEDRLVAHKALQSQVDMLNLYCFNN